MVQGLLHCAKQRTQVRSVESEPSTLPSQGQWLSAAFTDAQGEEAQAWLRVPPQRWRLEYEHSQVQGGGGWAEMNFSEMPRQ